MLKRALNTLLVTRLVKKVRLLYIVHWKVSGYVKYFGKTIYISFMLG